MAIGWSSRQREEVDQILRQHPAESSKWHDAAHKARKALLQDRGG